MCSERRSGGGCPNRDHTRHQDLQAARHRHDVGTATTADVLQFQLDLATALQALIQARITAEPTRMSWAVGGIDGASEALREGTYDPTPLSLPDSAIVTLACARRRRCGRLAIHRARPMRPSRPPAPSTSHADPRRQLHVGVHAVTNGNLVPGWPLTWAPVSRSSRVPARGHVGGASAASYAATYAARDAERNARSQAHALLGAVV